MRNENMSRKVILTVKSLSFGTKIPFIYKLIDK